MKEEKAKDKQIAKLEKEVSKLKDELSQAKESMREKVMKATGSQQEVKQLKKELAEAKKQSGKGGGGGGSDDGELKKELDDAKKTIKDMQDDLRKKDSELVRLIDMPPPHSCVVTDVGRGWAHVLERRS